MNIWIIFITDFKILIIFAIATKTQTKKIITITLPFPNFLTSTFFSENWTRTCIKPSNWRKKNENAKKNNTRVLERVNIVKIIGLFTELNTGSSSSKLFDQKTVVIFHYFPYQWPWNCRHLLKLGCSPTHQIS